MKNSFFIMVMLFVTLKCISQIGINTDQPQALLHIASTSGSLADDVVITNNGRVGIGTRTPTTKLDIVSTSAGAIRIVDGMQGVNRMLVSDANGVGSWASVVGSWYAVLQGRWSSTDYKTTYTRRLISGFSEQIHSNILQGRVNKANGTIQVPFDGKYRISIGGHWASNRVDGTHPYLIMPRIFVNGADRWAGNTIGYSNVWGLSPTFIAIIDAKANDVLTLYNDETTGVSANLVDECIFMVEFLQ